jgi:hypothetical protein
MGNGLMVAVVEMPFYLAFVCLQYIDRRPRNEKSFHFLRGFLKRLKLSGVGAFNTE